MEQDMIMAQGNLQAPGGPTHDLPNGTHPLRMK